MEAYKIWASLNLKGDAWEKMKKFQLATQKATETLAKLGTQLKSLDGTFVGLADAIASATKSTDSLTAGLAGIRNSLRGVSADAKLASASMRGLGASSAGAEVAGAGAAMGGGGGGRRKSNMRLFESFRLGPAHRGFLAGVTGIGSVGSIAATAGGFLGYESLSQSSQYQKKLAQLQSVGFTPGMISQARAATSNPMTGVSPVQQLEALKDAQMATRKFSDALKLFPTLAKAGFVSGSIYDRFSDGNLQDAIKIAEIRGGTNVSQMKKELGMVMQMYTTSGGTIDPTAFRAFFTRANAVATRMSIPAFLALEPTFQVMKPTSVGQSYRTLSNELVSHKGLSKKTSAFLQKIGIFNKQGNLPANFANVLATDPEAFINQIWMGQLAKAGITSPAGIQQANMMLGSTPGGLAQTIETNASKAQRARQQAGGLLSIDQQNRIAMQSLSGSGKAFIASLETLGKSIGDLGSPTAIKVMNSLTAMFNSLAKAANWLQGHHGLNRSDMFGGTSADQSAMHKVQDWWKGLTAHGHSSSTNKIEGNVFLDKNKLVGHLTDDIYKSMNMGGNQVMSAGYGVFQTPSSTASNSFGGFN